MKKEREIAMKALFLSVAVGVLSSCSGEYGYGPMGMRGPDGCSWPMMHFGFGGMFMWVFIVVIIGLLIYLFV